ncbi:MAG: ATP-dependent zinc metalloprotease FtsH [Peptococcaceae bacterium]|nr:ATP-dependent zinc metalloprotease FtsH [Peptococcaceae bacterium]
MKNTAWKSFAVYLVIFLLFFSMIEFFGGNTTVEETKQVYGTNYTEFMENVEKGKIKEVTITTYDNYQEISGVTKDKETFKMPISKNDDNLTQKLVDKGIKVTQAETPEPSPLFSLLSSLLPVLLLVGLFFFFMSQTQGGGGKMSQFGKSKARMTVDSSKRVTFNDVAGADEVKEELSEVVDFLKKPQKFKAIGAKIPKGVLLFGPPGTGKTLLARAVAGEAGVPFFTISGSDFVEMFVGVGASRVRDLFEQAKKNSPCIIFIDEIDAVGRQRGAGVGGGHDEREQTLNQLLVEMDGFDANEGIIILAATNRPDILDPALLRPGRFDRQVTVGRPDVRGREEILKVHVRNKPLSAEVDLKVIAKQTAGFTGADLANLVNEAALLAAREGLTDITQEHLEKSIERVIAGPEKKNRAQISQAELNLVSYHEAGHAVIGHYLEGCDPIHKVSIIPRGSAGGYTMSLPVEDRNYMTRTHLIHEVTMMLGGRVAEEIVLGEISTGASNDIERATNTIRQMVTRWGMSEELGTICFGEDEQQVFLGRDLGHSRNYSEAIAFSIDKEVKRIMDECHTRAHELLNEHRDKLDAVAKALQEREVINAFEFQGVMDGKDMDTIEREEAEYLAKLNEEKKKKIEEAKKAEPMASAPKVEPAKVDIPFFMQQKFVEQPADEGPQPISAPKAPEAPQKDDEEADEADSHWEGYPGLKGKMSDEELGLPSRWHDEDDNNNK